MTRKRALITGASSGLGKALVLALAKQEYDLILVARREQLLNNISKEITNVNVQIIPCDISSEQQTDKLIEIVEPVDLLIANAGTRCKGNDWHTIRKTYEVNLLGNMKIVYSQIPSMIQQGKGHIVGISSLMAMRGVAKHGPYCASKAAFSTHLNALRGELSRHNVRVTVVHPGFIKTPMTADYKYTPFAMTESQAATKILSAIAKNKKVYNFPWPLALLAALIRRF